MRIGVPRERMDGERRVALTPAGIRALRNQGHTVLVETGAGAGAGFEDVAYREAGAVLAGSGDELYREATLIVKVKEPLVEEWRWLRPGHIVFAFLHLAAQRPLVDVLSERTVTAIAYELIEDAPGSFPLLAPMSEIAGQLAVLVGAMYLAAPWDGPGVLLGGTAWVPGAHVLVLGGGMAGKAAARAALGMGGRVTLVERSSQRAQMLAELFHGRATIRLSSPDVIDELIPSTDLLIGAVMVPGDRAPVLVTREQIARMPARRVAVDVAIDQGGCFETSRPTSHSDPVFTAHGVRHYCVSNMPGAVPRTATLALTGATLPWIAELASGRLDEAVRRHSALAKAICIYEGRLVHPVVAEAHGCPCTSLAELCGAPAGASVAH